MTSTFDEFVESMSMFLIFPDVEDEMDALVQNRIDQLSAPKNGGKTSEDLLFDYLTEDKDSEKLKLVIAMSGGSVEKLKRILSYLFHSGSLSQIRDNADARRQIARFLTDPDRESRIPRFVRRSFSLPENWAELLSDGPHMNTVVRSSLVSSYSVKMGFKLEQEVQEIVTDLGKSYEKGSVYAVDNKEVDLAIPNCDSPQALIMSSYSLTTSSSQTTRANEQAAMYDALQKFNRSRRMRETPSCIFINVVDGGGWISRRNDLKQLWANCDHCFSFNTLQDMRELLERVL